MKYIVLILLLVSCSKYQVVQEVNLNMYHLHNPKTNKSEVILTEQKLLVGEYYRIKSIKPLDVEAYERKVKKCRK